MERIHVTGLGPRTGTTLMAELMIACFAIDAFDAHETRACRLRRDCTLYLSKWPGELASVRRRLGFDRHFHVICMLRDPRDVVTSRHGKDGARYWAPLRLWKQNFGHAKALRDHPRVVAVHYEDLVARPNDVQAEIARRLPFLRATGAFSDFHRRSTPTAEGVAALGGVRSFGSDSVGKWRNHLPRLAGQLAQHGPVTAELIELGYEPDDKWLAMLDGIEPDMNPSHWPDASRRTLRPKLRRMRRAARDYASLARAALERAVGRTIG